MGTWASASSVIPSASTCSDFKWNATEQTATTAKGSFSATCAGDLKVAGTAQGTLSGSVISWTANGDRDGPDSPELRHHADRNGRARRQLDPRPLLGRHLPREGVGVEILNKK